MIRITFVRAIAVLSLVALGLAAANLTGFKHFPSADLATQEQELVRTVSGNKPTVAVLERSAATTTAIIHRALTGEAELHEEFGDFFIVRSGSATLVLGGTLQEPRKVGPGEFAAPRIVGGETRTLATGDVVHVPPKLPHHVVLAAGQTITYLIIKAKE